MKKSKDGMLALLNNAGLPDSLQEVCFNHSTYLQGFLMPRKRYNKEHTRITPVQAFTGIVPSYKRIKGMVIGMRCWWYNCTELRNAMTKHDGVGWWCGFDDEMPGGHVMWDPSTHSLVRRAQMNGDPTTLYHDLMGPLCDLRARMLRSARGNTEADFRNIMEAIRRSEHLQREHRAAHRDVLRQTQQGTDALEQVLKLGKMLDESAMDLLKRYENIEKEVVARRKEEYRLRMLSKGGVVSQSEGGAASRPVGGDAEDVIEQRPKRARKKPADTSWKNASWDAMQGTFGKVDTLE